MKHIIKGDDLGKEEFWLGKVTLVTGGRDYGDAFRLAFVLDHAKPTMIIEGGQTGADLLAQRWARRRGVHVAEVAAQWKVIDNAGPRRNEAMLALNPKVVIAFPGGIGTADMVSRAVDRGIRVVEVLP